MISMFPLLAQMETTVPQLLTGIENIGKLGVGVLAVLVALGVLVIAYFNNRGNSKVVEANNSLVDTLLRMYGEQAQRQNALDARLDTQERTAQKRHDESTQTITEQTAVLKQLVGAVGVMTKEVVAMRKDNQTIQELQQQIAALQKMVERQARQLEDQAMEMATLRESNAALVDNLETERKARTQAEIQLAKEREEARKNEDRNAKAVQLLKDQFNALQKEFDTYKAKMNDKANKEAPRKHDLSQHPEQPDTPDE